MKQRLLSLLQQLGAAIATNWLRLLCALSNLRRRIFRKRLPDYAVFVLDRELEERPPSGPWWQEYIPGRKEPLTIKDLSEALQRVAGDPDVKGVLFLFKGATLSIAQAQSLAALFARFRQWDEQYRRQTPAPAKQIMVHLEQISGASYIVACAVQRAMGL